MWKHKSKLDQNYELETTLNEVKSLFSLCKNDFSTRLIIKQSIIKTIDWLYNKYKKESFEIDDVPF